MDTPAVISKLPAAGTTIFTVMSQLAMQHNAVNLGQGFPDFPMDEALVNEVSKGMHSGLNQYAHMNGLPLLRQRIANKAQKLYGATVDPETEITVTPGATYAIYTALTTVLQPGDEVIVFEPAYDSYIPNIVINGATPELIPLEFPGYRINWEKVKQKITPKTRMIMINSPHNPTGTVLEREDLLQLTAITEGTKIVVLSDEVYEHLVFDNKTHESVLRYPELRNRSFICSSFGKTYHCTGWKLGYCIAPPALMQEFRKVHQYNAFSTNTPAQAGIAAFMEHEDAYRSLGKFMQQKRDYFAALMQSLPFTPLDCKGSYFLCYSYAGWSNETDKELAIRLTKEYGVATIPVSSFYQDGTDNKVLRFCFAKKESTLKEAVERLREVKSET
jgi:methionine transaminase